MTPGFAARRRAEEFNSLVEGTSTQGPAPRHADALELVSALRSAAPVEPRAEFVSDLRRQLMTEAATVLTPTAARLTVTPRRARKERRIAVAIGGFAVVSATTSMAMAAQTALPGDTLYPLKRALENASTSIQVDEEAKGASLLQQASGRLDEVDELTQQGDEPNAQAVTDTLHAFSEQASEASELMIAAYTDKGQESDIEELRMFTAQSMAALNDLETVVPEPARAALIEAAQVLNLIDSQAISLCPSCGEGGVQVPAFEAAAVVDDVVDGLGETLGGVAAPKPAKVPDKHAHADGPTTDTAGESPEQQGDDEPRGPADPPRDEPDVAPSGGPSDDGRSEQLEPQEPDVLKDLTDRLTGGGTRPDGQQGGLGEVLEDAVGNITGLLGR